MNVPLTTLKNLQCEVCKAYLSRAPVYLQHDETALCGLCFTPERTAIRNTHYEALAKIAVFPCKYKKLGCENTVPLVQGDVVIPHEEVCNYRKWMCPIFDTARCEWLGFRNELFQHCQNQHMNIVLQNPCTLEQNIINSKESSYLIHWQQKLFLFYVKVSVPSGTLNHSLHYIGYSKDSKNFSYNIYIKSNGESILVEGEVMPQDHLVTQEHTTLLINNKELLSVLGGFNNAIFTVAVQRRVYELSAVQRTKCEIAMLSHCKTRRCIYQDNAYKCRKHEWFFCQQRTKCWICDVVVKRGSFFAHRSSGCLPVCRAGSIWRATHGVWRCLVFGAAGIAVCWYWLIDESFDLSVSIPLASERLREFRCVVSVIQPATGFVRTYSPGILYDKECDWLINVPKSEFPSWDCVFDVSVDVTMY